VTVSSASAFNASFCVLAQKMEKKEKEKKQQYLAPDILLLLQFFLTSWDQPTLQPPKLMDACMLACFIACQPASRTYCDLLLL
jgi:hypothetical protein